MSLFTLPRRGIASLVAITSFVIGSVLIWNLLNPRVIGSVPTSTLALVFALQLLPMLTWMAWRLTGLTTAAGRAKLSRVEAAIEPEVAEPAAGVSGRLPAVETVHVHRVVRTGPRPGPAKVPSAVRSS